MNLKKCPFKSEQCDESCALYIKYEDLNELVLGRLRSIGVIGAKDEGMCSFKNLALAQSRTIFENTKVYRN